MKNILNFFEAVVLSALYVAIPVLLVIWFGWHPVFVFIGWAILTGIVVLVLEALFVEKE